MNGEQTQRAAFEAHFGDCFDNIEPGLRAVARVWAWQGWLAAQTQMAPEPRDQRAADMIAVCAALGFDPTNHHNAAKCPYCRPATPEAPEGWKLVPIEPTPEMLSAYLAAQRAYCEDMDNYGKFGMLFTPAKATAAGYAAMLAASPQSETPGA